MITGEQRLRNIKTKARIVAHRAFDEFLAGKRDWLPCLDDITAVMITREFERLQGQIASLSLQCDQLFADYVTANKGMLSCHREFEKALADLAKAAGHKRRVERLLRLRVRKPLGRPKGT